MAPIIGRQDGRVAWYRRQWGPMRLGGSILITGAGGSIGSALAKKIAQSDARRLILLDNAEHELHEIELGLDAINRCALHTAVVGDICDAALLAELFDEYRPDIVYHAAAFKHVPMMERNALAAIRNNVLGTLALARAASQHDIAQLVMISTDKAVNPTSAMGVSKRIAELVLLRWNSASAQMKALRLGNVLGSRGSVVPLFVEQISGGGPVTVTHPDVQRYFVTLHEAVDAILAAGNQDGGGIFVSKPAEAIKIVDLARQMIRDAGFVAGTEIPIVFTQLRPGDKLAEEMFFADESVEPTGDDKLRRVRGPQIAVEQFDAEIAALAESVEHRDLVGLVDTLVRIVPQYEPSKMVCSETKPLARTASK
jgi:FlaA1/EpsC-like NDP-sugar epimerase